MVKLPPVTEMLPEPLLATWPVTVPPEMVTSAPASLDTLAMVPPAMVMVPPVEAPWVLMFWRLPLSTVRLPESSWPSNTTESPSAISALARVTRLPWSMLTPHWFPEVVRPSTDSSVLLTTMAYQRQLEISTFSKDSTPAW